MQIHHNIEMHPSAWAVQFLTVLVLVSLTFIYLRAHPAVECRCLMPHPMPVHISNLTNIPQLECPEYILNLTTVTPPAQIEATSSRERTDVVLMVPIPAAWGERRDRFASAFMAQNLNRRHAILLFVFGSRLGLQLEMENPDIHSVQRIQGIDYFHAYCRDHGENFNTVENTASMACKVYEGFKHAASTYTAKYIWRVDSDSYLNIKLFINTMAPSLPDSRLFMGRLRRPSLYDTDLLLDLQPNLRELFGLHQFGHYMSGMGFMLTWDVLEFVSSLTIPPRINWCDDVLVAMWLMPFQIQFKDVNSMPDYVMFGAEERASYINPAKHVLLVHYMRPHDWKNIDPITGVLHFND